MRRYRINEEEALVFIIDIILSFYKLDVLLANDSDLTAFIFARNSLKVESFACASLVD